MQVIDFLSKEQVERWLSSHDRPCLIEFYATWCIYHLLTVKKLKRLHEALGDTFSAGSFNVVDHEGFVGQYGIDQIPTIMYQDGTRRLTWVGDTDIEIMLANIRQLQTLEHPSHE